MHDFKERIFLFIQAHAGVSIREFERKCGLTNGQIASIGAQGPTASVLTKISDTYPELNLNWLFRGEGEMILSKTADTPGASVSIGSVQTINIGNWNELINLLKNKV